MTKMTWWYWWQLQYTTTIIRMMTWWSGSWLCRRWWRRRRRRRRRWTWRWLRIPQPWTSSIRCFYPGGKETNRNAQQVQNKQCAFISYSQHLSQGRPVTKTVPTLSVTKSFIWKVFALQGEAGGRRNSERTPRPDRYKKEVGQGPMIKPPASYHIWHTDHGAIIHIINNNLWLSYKLQRSSD